MTARLTINEILLNVIREKRSLEEAINQQLKNKFSKENAFIKACCYGVLRYYFRLDAIAACLLKKEFKSKDQDILVLILVALFQLLYSDKAEAAIVSETVECTKTIKKNWATALVNGVLRTFLRERQAILSKVETDLVATSAHPEWMLRQLQHDWPQNWKAIIEKNNQQSAMILRLDTSQQGLDDYLKKLEEADIAADAHPFVESAIVLAHAIDVQKIPGFNEGIVSVQDAGAQLAARLLDLKSGLRVLDACAAPGGKTLHILQSQTDLAELVVIEKGQARTSLIQENLSRAKLSAKLITADAADTNAWWDEALFDRILLDVPCSATGVIARHPDIKLLRRETDIPQSAKQQLRLLKHLWPLLKPGGLLLYTTCSVFKEENETVIRTFLSESSDAEEQPIKADWGVQMDVGRQLLPAEFNDGFYFARMIKR